MYKVVQETEAKHIGVMDLPVAEMKLCLSPNLGNFLDLLDSNLRHYKLHHSPISQRHL